jgi:hypothetical protein
MMHLFALLISGDAPLAIVRQRLRSADRQQKLSSIAIDQIIPCKYALLADNPALLTCNDAMPSSARAARNPARVNLNTHSSSGTA